MSYKKIGNIMWYVGHCICIFGMLPSLISVIKRDDYDRYVIAVLITFSLAGIGQIIVMLSRYIERYDDHKYQNNGNDVKLNKIQDEREETIDV